MRIQTVLASFLAIGLLAPTALAQSGSPLADPGRPAEDVARDTNRKPLDVIAFAGVKSGDRVIDFIPGGGYFTRILSGVVGPKGHVYATVPAVAADYQAKLTATITTFAQTHPNVSVEIAKTGFAPADGPVDVFWTAQNYHDLYNPTGPSSGPPPLLFINKTVFAALKPGGVYLIIDHDDAPGAGVSHTKSLHRIEAAVVRKDVEAAGFVFEGESNLLRNPADPHTAVVFDPSIRGHTDQFIYKFRKPKA